ncbi:hypothetical protein D3C87_233770 [compost metagenome]
MKTIILQTAMTCALFFGSNSLFAQQVQTGPQISTEKESHDFKEIAFGGDGNHTFIVKNTGTEPLKLEQVKPSCSCSVADFTKDPILPGKTGEIKVHYDTKREGPFNKSFTVISNAVDTPTMMLKIKGTVLVAQTTALEPVSGTMK